MLTGAGLLIRSFEKLIAVDPGFRPQGILTAWVQLPNAKYEKDERKNQFFAQLLDNIRHLPNVRSASADAFLPFTGIIAGTGVDVEGRPKLPPSEQPTIDVALVEPDFFETMGIPLLKGRAFTQREGVEATHKVVISDAMAKKLWPNENPIGKRVTIYMKRENSPSEVIGVVGDVKHAGLDANVHPTAYWPYPELSFPFMTLVIRTDGDAAALAPALRQTVLQLDKDQPRGRRASNGVLAGRLTGSHPFCYTGARSICGNGSTARSHGNLWACLLRRRGTHAARSAFEWLWERDARVWWL